MAELDPALAAALAGERATIFGAVEINLPDYDLLLIDGAAEVPIGGRTFVGRDPTYGVLDTIRGLSDKIDNQAPVITLGLIPASDAGLGALLDPAVQGSPVIISIGALDMATGLPIGAPYVLFSGELDVPTVNWAANDRRLEYRIGSVFERLFATEEGRRLSDSFHQLVWPGELGLAFVTGVEAYVPWGQKLDTSAIETRTNMPGLGGITWKRT